MANGSFIKHKLGIYTVGQKDTSPPSGTRKEKSQGAAPKVREQLNREKRKPGGCAQAQRKADPGTLPVGENLACRWNYHDSRGRVLSKLHPWAVGEINITGEGSSMLHPQADAVEPGSRTALQSALGKNGEPVYLQCVCPENIFHTVSK